MKTAKELRKEQRKHYKKFCIDLYLEEYEELMHLLKEKNMRNVNFVRNAIKELKNK